LLLLLFRPCFWSVVVSLQWARSFVGRLMADPAFIQKMAFEQVLAFSSSMLYEWRVRGDSFKKELDLALINSVGMAAAVGATVWITAPSRAYGAVHKFPWQQMLANLPHCVFDASGPLRQYSNTARLGGFFASMAQLSAVGALAGGATALASQAAVQLHQKMEPDFEPSVPVADAGRSSAGLGAFFAVNANTRYQLLGGMDRYLFGHSNFMWTYMGFSLLARGMFASVGEMSRPWWQGLTQETAASHVAAAKKLKRVRRKVNKSGTATSTLPGAAAHQQAAAAAAAAAAVAVAPGSSSSLVGDSSSSSLEGAAAAEQQQQLGDYQPIGSSSSSSVEAAAAALNSYQPISADDALEVSDSAQVEAVRQLGSLEASMQQHLEAGPAVMGGASALHELVQQPQLQHQQSLGDSAMGAALRDAVAESVTA
jgi:hypothetical protein